MASETFTAVDLSKLPAPKLVEEPDLETIASEGMSAALVVMPDHVFRPSDPSTKLLYIFAYREILLRQRVNAAARGVMIAYAEGSDLDNLGALLGVTRFLIAEGDPVLGIPDTMESDEDFRRRIVLGPEGYSVAGPEGAYIFHALSADPQVLDASAYSPEPDSIRDLVLGVLADHSAAPELVAAMTAALDGAIWPGQVIVTTLSREGDGTADPELLAAVDTYVSAEKRRPLTDYVTVQSAVIVPYEVEASITTFSGPDGGVVMAAAQAKLEAYIESSHRLGRDITISGLHAALHVEGVHNVVLTKPEADIVISREEAPYCTSVNVTYAGLGE